LQHTTKFLTERVGYDGEIMEVVEMHPVAGMLGVLTRDIRNDTVRRFALDELMYSARGDGRRVA
jgi:hypothetical protein